MSSSELMFMSIYNIYTGWKQKLYTQILMITSYDNCSALPLQTVYQKYLLVLKHFFRLRLRKVVFALESDYADYCQ